MVKLSPSKFVVDEICTAGVNIMIVSLALERIYSQSNDNMSRIISCNVHSYVVLYKVGL